MSSEPNGTHEIKSLKIAQINIRSIVSHAKREEFRLFLRKNKPHIVMISETHLKSKHKVNFDGYKFYRCDRENASHGGVAICMLESIKSSQIIINESVQSIESCSVQIETLNGPIVFSAIYRKPNINIKCDNLSVIINSNKNAKFVIAGDFNAHCATWGSKKICTNGRMINEWYNKNKPKYNIKIVSPAKPSCHSNGTNSYIDFAIMSANLNILNCDTNGKLPSEEIFSDHSVIFMQIACDKILVNKPTSVKNFKKTNWFNFNKYVDEKINNLNIPVYRNISCVEIDSICANVENIFINAIKKFVPEIKIPYGKVELSTKSLKLIKEKKNLLRKKYRNRNNENIVQIKSQLKRVNQMMVHSISDDYRMWWKNKLKNIRPDNNLFKNIKQISKYKSMGEVPSTIFNENKSNKFVTEQEKCDAFSNHFAAAHELTFHNQSSMQNEVRQVNELYENPEPILNFSPDLPANFKNNNTPSFQRPIHSTFFVSATDVQNIIKSRNSKKSSGIDNMPNYVLKKLSITTIYWIAVIFNHITNIQYIPSNWKVASVTPVPKPNKNNEIVNNWRPISQLPTISKCYEKIIDNLLRKECEERNLLDPFQFGFQPGCSTIHAIAKIVSDISNGLNNSNPTMAILIDLQSAFDVIWHDGMIFKLHQMNIKPPIIALIKNYLANRKFYVKINDKKSNTKDIIAGTPQGSIISALLFILYLNDLPKPSNYLCKINRLLFADDIIFYTITKNIQFARLAMNAYLKDIYNFLSKWKLKMNVNKCESISFVGHYKDLNMKIRKEALACKFTLNGINLTKSTKVKYLGIILSQNFQFSGHVKHIMKKVNAAQAMLYSLFKNKFLDKIVKIIMYKQLIRPLIMYASPCWLIQNLVSSYQVEQIRKKERFFLRKCCNIYRNLITKKYINSRILYNEAKINRIDRELIKSNLKFVEKSKLHSKQVVREIFNVNTLNPEVVKYKPIDYFNILHNENRLHENNMLLVFNKKRHKPDEYVYVQAQNVSDV